MNVAICTDFRYAIKFSHELTVHCVGHPKKWTAYALPNSKMSIWWFFSLKFQRLDTGLMFIHNSPPYAIWLGITWLVVFKGMHSIFIMLLTVELFFVVVALILIIRLFKEIFNFIATDKLEKCKLPKLTAREVKLSHKIEFNHNSNVSYKCKGKYKHSTCINGRWDPELTCTGKLLFVIFSKFYSISS